MPEAIGYANAVVTEYRKGMADQANLTSWTGAVLIPVSAVAVGLGIRGGHSNAITNLAVGGAGAYALSSWLSSPNRSLVYAEGIGAMNCAKQAMLPFYLSDDSRRSFEAAIADLNDTLIALQPNFARVQNAANALEKKTGTRNRRVQAAEAALSAARRSAEAGAATLENGYKLQLKLERAGQTLVFAVDRIRGEVDKALLATVPNLSALPGIISGLSQTSDLFRQVPPVGAGAAMDAAEKAADTDLAPGIQKSRADSDELGKALRALAETLGRLSAAEAKVRAVVASFEQPVSSEVLKQCGVAEEDIIQPLRVNPDNRVQFTAKQAGAEQRFLSGGSGQYVVTDTNKRSGLTVEQPIPLGAAVNIAATSDIEEGLTRLLVQDTAGRTAFIDVDIRPKTQGDTPKPAPITPIEVPTPFETALNQDKQSVKGIQRALVLCNEKLGDRPIQIDGVLGPETWKAAERCDAVAGRHLDKAMVDTLRSHYLEGNLPKTGPQTGAEKQLVKMHGLGSSQLKDLYQLLGATLPEDEAVFDQELRKRLLQFQQSSASLADTGLYSSELANLLCATKDEGGSTKLCRDLN